MTPLVPHPSTPERAFGVAAGVERVGATVLRVVYRLVGALDGVVLPAPTASRRRDRLWEHTCFEAFVSPGDGDGYVELNVAPSSEWAVYAFDRYREAASTPTPAAPDVVISRGTASLDVEATLSVAPGALRVGLTAVVERADGARSYWALCHPAAAPDFHHVAGWVVRLPPG